MKRTIFVSMLSGFFGSALLLLLLSATGIVGARGVDVRSDVPRANEVSAATPLTSTFTYQGQLKSSGNPVSDTCNFKFGLWDSATGGAQIGLTQTLSAPVSSGYFTALLNNGNPFGNTAFNGDARWLALAVDCPSVGGGYIAFNQRQPLTSLPFALPGLRTFPNATSPNIIGGYSGNFISATVVGSVIGGGGASGELNRVQANYGTVSGGEQNTASNLYATVGGGWANTASGDGATIGGGEQNTASKYAATVSGGANNVASDNMATIGGGSDNAAGFGATVGGGELNHANSTYATVGGGVYNYAIGVYATASGGQYNLASGTSATVGGGEFNQASGYASTIPGGENNLALMTYTLAAGNLAQAANQGAFVWADSTNAYFSSTGNDQFLIRANGGVGINTNVPTTNTLTVSGSGLKVGTNGSIFGTLQGGMATLGAGASGTNVYTVTFPTAFATTPTVIATARNDPGYPDVNDTFSITIRRISTTAFVVNVNGGGGWSQSLKIDWLAWE